MPEIEPTNAVLAEMIRNLEERLEDRDESEVRYHIRMETKIDSLAATVVQLQSQVNVHDATDEEKFKALDGRLAIHDGYHRDKEKSEQQQRKMEVQKAQFLTGALSAGVAIVALLLGYLLH